MTQWRASPASVDPMPLILQDLRVKHNAYRAQELKVFGVTPKQIVLVNCEGSVDSRVTRITTGGSPTAVETG